jgi:hypothetical protein
MKKCNCVSNESQIVFENNNDCKCSRCEEPKYDYGPDPINIFDIKGRHVGYSWEYGDNVELVIDIQNTVLRVREDQLDELEAYLSDKELEINFINMRGEIKYTFYTEAKLISKIRLNSREDNLIDKNTYTCTAVLINPIDMSRINLLRIPYRIYVK